MKGKKFKIFGVMMALAMVVSMMSVGIAAADPGSLKWSEINIPEEGAGGDYVLWSGSDVGPIVVSPDGGTIFAASGEDEATDTLMRSADGGSTWKMVVTKIDGDDEATSFDDIVAIAVSPDYDGDSALIVATENDVYYSGDKGSTFDSMKFDGEGAITSVDLATDENGNLNAFLVGAEDVYLKEGQIGSWAPQGAEVDNVLDVAFSVNYSVSEQIIAAVGNPVGVKAKFSQSEWSATALLKNEDAETIDADHASIGLPDDYNARSSIVFVGVEAGGEGDVFRVEYVGDPDPITGEDRGDWFDPSYWETSDLNVRGKVGTQSTETDIWSIAVSGTANAATILAGTVEFNREPDQGNTQYLVYASDNSGETWTSGSKQPTGDMEAVVVFGSNTAYVGTSGDESAFSALAAPLVEPYTISHLMSWNQLSLIDTDIDEITAMMPSLSNAADSTLYIVTSGADTNSLWITMDNGLTWERGYCSTLTNMGEIDPDENICVFDMIRVTFDGGIVVAEGASREMRLSSDSGRSWGRRIAPVDVEITALSLVSMSTFYIGDTAGNVYETTDGGFADWTPATGAIQEAVIQIAIGPDNAILVGNNAGTAYICYDRSVAFEFERVGPAAGTGITLVAFDTNYIENKIVYAACTGTGAVYRFVIDESSKWTKLEAGIGVSGLMVATDGTLYVSDVIANAGVARSVNPTSVSPEPEFYSMTNDLPAGATLAGLIVIPGGSNLLYAINTAGNQLLTLTDTLTGKTQTVAPADGAITGVIIEDNAEARVVLAWTNMEKATEYEVQVALDEDFGTKLDIGDAAKTEGEVVAVYLFLGVDYYWRVRATEPLPSQWSDTQMFATVLGPGGARPMPHDPAFGETDVTLKPVLQWSGIADATNYELQVATDCDFGNLVIDKTGSNQLGSETAYAITSDLNIATDYCWKVRAINQNSASPWSDTSHFKTASTATDPAEGTPTWVWVVIAISAILLIAVIVLIVRTRRAT